MMTCLQSQWKPSIGGCPGKVWRACSTEINMRCTRLRHRQQGILVHGVWSGQFLFVHEFMSSIATIAVCLHLALSWQAGQHLDAIGKKRRCPVHDRWRVVTGEG
eukprot:2075810-Amphidinium_carterae.1